MNKLTLFFLIWLIIIIIYGEQLIVPFDCERRIGEVNSSSTISCESDEILVSCGIINGLHKIQGTYIDPSNSNTCIVGASNTSYFVIAVANCCKFPTGSIIGINTITNNNTNSNNTQVVTKCPNGSILTGCQINYQSGIINNIRGSYPGPKQYINTLPSQIGLINGINTENQCIAESQSLTTNIRGGAQCLEISSNYELGNIYYFNIYHILF